MAEEGSAKPWPETSQHGPEMRPSVGRQPQALGFTELECHILHMPHRFGVGRVEHFQKAGAQTPPIYPRINFSIGLGPPPRQKPQLVSQVPISNAAPQQPDPSLVCKFQPCTFTYKPRHTPPAFTCHLRLLYTCHIWHSHSDCWSLTDLFCIDSACFAKHTPIGMHQTCHYPPQAIRN